MIELVHDERELNAVLSSVIPPGFSKRMRAKVSSQPNGRTNLSDELPGTLSGDRLRVIHRARVEEQIMVWISGDTWIGGQVLAQRLCDTVVDDHLLAFATLFFAQPEAFCDGAALVDELTYLERQQIGDAQGGVNSDGEQEQVPKAPLAAQQVLDLGDFLAVSDRVDEVHSGDLHSIF